MEPVDRDLGGRGVEVTGERAHFTVGGSGRRGHREPVDEEVDPGGGPLDPVAVRRAENALGAPTSVSVMGARRHSCGPRSCVVLLDAEDRPVRRVVEVHGEADVLVVWPRRRWPRTRASGAGAEDGGRCPRRRRRRGGCRPRQWRAAGIQAGKAPWQLDQPAGSEVRPRTPRPRSASGSPLRPPCRRHRWWRRGCRRRSRRRWCRSGSPRRRAKAPTGQAPPPHPLRGRVGEARNALSGKMNGCRSLSPPGP